MNTHFFDLKNVTVSDSFWNPFLERVKNSVIPFQWEALNDRVPGADPSYSMRNFKLAAQITHPELDYGIPKDIGHGGTMWQDSDFAKWLEAAAYSLVWYPDPSLEKTIDEAIDIVCNAQQSDGYLDTFYIIKGLENRFTNLKDNHELYCFGHFLEAAIAYFESTGKRKLLDAIIRYADCVDSCIGAEEGKLKGYPGHEIAEMALVRLYEITGEEKHLNLARYFIDQRGQSPLYFEEEVKRNNNSFHWRNSHLKYQYYQAGRPVREQFVAEGHAVRATYLYSGMADLARHEKDAGLLNACNKIWDNIINKQLYITGGIGQSSHGESFSYDYDLPNDTVYAETCASIGLAFFARRMAAIAPNNTHGDIMEKTLYNGVISGMSLDGQAFFYVNPLEILPLACEKDNRMRHVKPTRQKWFGCACCPPNLARLIASLGSYFHSYNAELNTLYTHLYAGNDLQSRVNGGELSIKTITEYPWKGDIDISFYMKESIKFNYALRIPSWCKNYSLKLNDAIVNFRMESGFAILDREWVNGDRISLNLDMPVEFVKSNPSVRANIGKIAVMKGPIVYCLEEEDNGKELFRLSAGKPENIAKAKIKVNFQKDFLEGVNVITIPGKRLSSSEENLYSTDKDQWEDKELKFIPYYAWANRKPGEMTVWINGF